MAVFVFFGASGDLVGTKLLPAAGRLLKEGVLPPDTRIIGVSRKSWSDDDFRDVVRARTPDIPLPSVSFVSGDILDEELPERLARAISGQQAFFYFALPPATYADALSCVARVRQLGNIPAAQVRVFMEKPFGTNAADAQRLNRVIDETVGEASVLRVDHYIEKDSVQNILAYRFSNELFSGVWNAHATSRIHVFLHEADTAERRGAFYDATGALSDVVQNHALQMLAAATMDNPGMFSADNVRQARCDVFSRLRILPEGNHIRAQYAGYRDTPGVAAASETETYARIECFIDHPSWENVPIILEAGKGLPARESGVRMHLAPSQTRICFDEECAHENVFEFSLAPQETTTLSVWGKKPGLASALAPHALSFSLADAGDMPYVDRAYDRVLFDAWRGDASRFVSREESLAAWAFTDAAHETLSRTPLLFYERGTMPRV